MGRVVRKINTDGTDSPTLNDSDVLIYYEGCGCAGGLVTTVEGELVPRTDTTGNARRKQKAYSDILGRTYKTETYEWDGTTVYSTVTSQFNGSDQVLRTRQYAGSDASTTFQDTLATFDGHGRLKSSHRPEQRDSSNTPTFTTYNYNPDDSISWVTDGRGAVTSYTYENNSGTPLRPLVTGVAWSVPQNSEIEVPATVSFTFDNLGNRTEMTDGTGTTTYQYDPLSRITSETKTFTGLSGNFTLEYEYQLNGSVKQIDILPNSTEVTYHYDKMGRVESIAGQGFIDARYNNAVITNIASYIKYRAWNNLKSMEFGNPASVNIDYNNRLNTSNFSIPGLMEIDYEYYADGRIKFADKELGSNSIVETFDRSYQFDHIGRMTSAKSGAEASGGTQMTGPYRQEFAYDAFSNTKSRDTIHWSATYTYGFTANYENRRRTDWHHDSDGNVTTGGSTGPIFVFDADGSNTVIEQQVDQNGCSLKSDKKKIYSDGDGQRTIIHDEKRHFCGAVQWTSDLIDYNLKSSVLGGAVVFQLHKIEKWSNGGGVNYSGTNENTRIFLHGKLLANYQWLSINPTWYPHFSWHHVDPTGNTVGQSQLQSSTGFYQNLVASLDPMGADHGLGPPEEPEPPPVPQGPFDYAHPEDIEWITVDGVMAPASHWPPGLLSNASRCPNDNCGPIRTEHGWEFWNAFADGYEGYMPMGAHYAGYGYWSWKTERQRLDQALENYRPSFFAPSDSSSDACEITQPDGSIVLGTLGPDGVCRPHIGSFAVTVPVVFGDHYRSYRTGNSYGSWTEIRRIEDHPSAADLAKQIRNLSPSPNRDLSALGNIVNNCGTAVGIGQYGTVNNGMWRGRNGQWYSTTNKFYGNQYTGSRANVMSTSNALKTMGRASFVRGTLISGVQVATGDISPAQGAMDVTMGTVGVFGGPKGLAISGTYFLYRPSLPPHTLKMACVL